MTKIKKRKPESHGGAELKSLCLSVSVVKKIIEEKE